MNAIWCKEAFLLSRKGGPLSFSILPPGQIRSVFYYPIDVLIFRSCLFVTACNSVRMSGAQLYFDIILLIDIPNFLIFRSQWA
jgi:hypothetical protein